MTDFANQNRTKLVATYEFLRSKRMVSSSSVVESHFKLVLSIKISQVKEEHIKNVFVQQKFYDIPRVRNMIAARQMRFIGKVVRGPWSRPAKRMLTACCANIRLAQRPNFHNKCLLVSKLEATICKRARCGD